ncbi:MAG: acetyl-CoA carboxylase carboxyltransferase subunit beta [Lentisphaerae bacterium]|nr:acetyl-CoA carboxylase carboxyltransferase subunit beta [Lentisphaerota bacterium]
MAWFSKTKQRKSSIDKDELWAVCDSCKAHVYREEWEKNLKVCPKCGYHERITCQQRLQLTIDEGTFEELDSDIEISDPLKFSDAKSSYADKAADTKAKTGLNEAVLTGFGTLNGISVVIAIMDFRFFGGSLGSGTGDKILLASDYALRHKQPYIVFSASGGARMQEGIISLMQMAKTCAGISRLNKAGVPYISVLTNPTFGGVSASYAMVGDINIAEPGALIGFAGRRVIEQTIKQKLPENFQTSEYLLEHGFIDAIVERKKIKSFLHSVLQYSMRK